MGLPFVGLRQLPRSILPDLNAVPAAQQRALRFAVGLCDSAEASLILIALATLSLIREDAVAHPAVVVLDDLRWLDEPTRQVLAFLARRIGPDPFVIVRARRAGYPDPFGDAAAYVIEVTGLDENGARQLLIQHAADRKAGLRHAAGNNLTGGALRSRTAGTA